MLVWFLGHKQLGLDKICLIMVGLNVFILKPYSRTNTCCINRQRLLSYFKCNCCLKSLEESRSLDNFESGVVGMLTCFFVKIPMQGLVNFAAKKIKMHDDVPSYLVHVFHDGNPFLFIFQVALIETEAALMAAPLISSDESDVDPVEQSFRERENTREEDDDDPNWIKQMSAGKNVVMWIHP